MGLLGCLEGRPIDGRGAAGAGGPPGVSTWGRGRGTVSGAGSEGSVLSSLRLRLVFDGLEPLLPLADPNSGIRVHGDAERDSRGLPVGGEAAPWPCGGLREGAAGPAGGGGRVPPSASVIHALLGRRR